MATVVVTGADSGIGAALARTYHARGDHVVAACLGTGEDHAGSGIEAVAGVDVTDAASFASLLSHLGDNPVNTLVCNAGIFRRDAMGEFDFEGMLEQYNVNSLGPLRAVQALHHLMPPGARIGIVTSRVGSIADNSSGGLYGYRMSKCAANMLGMNLYHEGKPKGIAVMLLHPGQVISGMTRGMSNLEGFVQPEQAAAGLIEQLDRLTDTTPPEFRHADGTLLPW